MVKRSAKLSEARVGRIDSESFARLSKLLSHFIVLSTFDLAFDDNVKRIFPSASSTSNPFDESFRWLP